MQTGWQLERRDGCDGTTSDDVGGGGSETDHGDGDDDMLLSFVLPSMISAMPLS